MKGGKMRDAGTIRERIYKALVARYTAEQEDALVKIDALLRGDVVPGHVALTEDIDKLLSKVAEAAEKTATLRQHYGTN
jgi:predicted exporter